MLPHELDYVLELWARWVNDSYSGGSGFGSMLEMMMVTGGVFSGGGHSPALYSVQAEVEASVMALAAVDRAAADILRVEYGVGYILPGRLDKKPRQIDKAHALLISLRTYKRRLSKAREFVLNDLRKRRVSAR
uniref:Uncharacterized protein n=1 Tax=Serratia proteamaculans (strain 568) TaxID=399741 RepID=A8GLP6_SERP5